MKKRFLSFLMAACMALALLPVTARAVEENYDTFDYRAYANIYPDLKAAYGYNAQKLYAHYVNYGKAEGRVGSFISGDNPKTNAPIFGLVSGTDYSHLKYTWDGLANVPATLLDPKPPTQSSQLDKWRMEQRTAIYWMSNAKLVAEWNHFKTYMTEDRPGSYKTEAVEVWTLQTIPYELEIRCAAAQTVYDYEHGVRNEYVDEESYNDAKNSSEYKRAAATDATILFQWGDRFRSLPAPPTDPGVAGQKPVPTVGGFSDVFENNYFAGPVVWAVGRKITSGKTASTFAPSETCSQAQILTFLWRSQGSPEPEGTVEMEGFTGTEYYYKAAQWAAERDMIEGGFDPDEPCTRAMAMTYMWKLAGSPDASAASFTDVPADAEYAPAVAWAVSQKITSGATATTFAPEQTCTRGQIMTFLYRAFANA